MIFRTAWYSTAQLTLVVLLLQKKKKKLHCNGFTSKHSNSFFIVLIVRRFNPFRATNFFKNVKLSATAFKKKSYYTPRGRPQRKAWSHIVCVLIVFIFLNMATKKAKLQPHHGTLFSGL